MLNLGLESNKPTTIANSPSATARNPPKPTDSLDRKNRRNREGEKGASWIDFNANSTLIGIGNRTPF